MSENKDDVLKHLLLSAPDSQLDISLKHMIEKWTIPIKAINVLELLDNIVYTGGASGFVINILNRLLQTCLVDEEITYEELIKFASWRHDG